jgi:hypothetical protein
MFIKIIAFGSIMMFLPGSVMMVVCFGQGFKSSGTDNVHIGPDGMMMPVERLILVRKGTDYCSIKFTRFWTGQTADDHYAEYLSYFQDDRSGDFTRSNVHLRKDELESRKTRRAIFGHSAYAGDRNIRCGFIKLRWSGEGTVYFYSLGQKEGDYGYELAPTKWTDIKEVNVFDPRLKWFKYDRSRKSVNIPVDALWRGK